MFANQPPLVNSRIKRELKVKDASQVLKYEIKGSQVRVKAAKYGHKLEDIAPPYADSFYLPDKTQYFSSVPNQPSRNLAVRNSSTQ